MLELKNRIVDDYGEVIITADQAYEMLLEGIDIEQFRIIQSEDLDAYNAAVQTYGDMPPLEAYEPIEYDFQTMDKARQSIWYMPEEYLSCDIKQYVLDKANNETEKLRILQEFDIFEKYELLDVLRLLKYLFDHFRKNEIVYGVGRGSSVSSFVLYLMGVHRVNSLKYGLDFSEFLE